jgi:hypothetical protein
MRSTRPKQGSVVNADSARSLPRRWMRSHPNHGRVFVFCVLAFMASCVFEGSSSSQGWDRHHETEGPPVRGKVAKAWYAPATEFAYCELYLDVAVVCDSPPAPSTWQSVIEAMQARLSRTKWYLPMIVVSLPDESHPNAEPIFRFRFEDATALRPDPGPEGIWRWCEEENESDFRTYLGFLQSQLAQQCMACTLRY